MTDHFADAGKPMPKALRLADELYAIVENGADPDVIYDAAAELRRLHAELTECDALRDRMANILTRTANALKGEPDELTLHSWHDLPEVAQTLRYELDAVPAIKEERDALQASQVAARKLLEAYAQVKAADEARMKQALNALDPPEHVRFGGTGRLKADAITALKERLK